MIAAGDGILILAWCNLRSENLITVVSQCEAMVPLVDLAYRAFFIEWKWVSTKWGTPNIQTCGLLQDRNNNFVEMRTPERTAQLVCLWFLTSSPWPSIVRGMTVLPLGSWIWIHKRP